MDIVLASSNKGKVKEIQDILKPLSINIKPMNEYKKAPKDIIEDGATFLDNALIKARTVYDILRCPVLADDSGLSIDALNGEPGVRSARYGAVGEEKPSSETLIKRVLHNMQNTPENKRTARFTAVMALKIDENTEIIAEGHCYGEIALSPYGDGGFGYDPIFYLKEYNKTMAEISPEEKNKISHRGKALENLISQLKLYMGDEND